MQQLLTAAPAAPPRSSLPLPLFNAGDGRAYANVAAFLLSTF